MHRALAILLLLLLGTPMLLPLLAATGDSEAGLQACCRRNGTHHCAMTMAERAGMSAESESRTVGAPRRGCPYMPVPTTPASFHVEASARGQALRLPLPAASRREGAAQTEVRRRIAAERARQKRGPPAFASQTLSL